MPLVFLSLSLSILAVHSILISNFCGEICILGNKTNIRYHIIAIVYDHVLLFSSYVLYLYLKLLYVYKTIQDTKTERSFLYLKSYRSQYFADYYSSGHTLSSPDIYTTDIAPKRTVKLARLLMEFQAHASEKVFYARCFGSI